MQPLRIPLVVLIAVLGSLLSFSTPLLGANKGTHNTRLHLEDTNGADIENGVVALTCDSLKPNDAADKPPAISKPAIMDQVNRQFVPHVLAVSVNTPVRFPNSDDIHHHVYSFSKAKPFELELYHDATAAPVVMNNEGMVVLGCNIHDQMLGYIFVVNSRHFGVSDVNGNIDIDTRDITPNTQCQARVMHPQLSSPFEASAIIITNGSNQSNIKLPVAITAPVKTEQASGIKGIFKPKRFGQ